MYAKLRNSVSMKYYFVETAIKFHTNRETFPSALPLLFPYVKEINFMIDKRNLLRVKSMCLLSVAKKTDGEVEEHFIIER